MPLFEIPNRPSGKSYAKKVAGKATTTTKISPTVKGGGSLVDRINMISTMVEQKLGQYKDKYELITSEDKLVQFIDKCIENKAVAIDTETDGLNPMLNHIAGPCLYTPGEKGNYIPVNHISYITQLPLKDQLPVEVVRREMQRLIDAHVFIVMFNAPFDIRVCRHQLGLKDIYCDWDCYIAARLLNENEPSNKLKPLHQKYVLNGKGDSWTFDQLFKGIPFTMIPPKVGYLYAARDPEITWEYYLFQKQYLTDDTDREDMKQVYWVFKNIEMPIVKVVCDMEDTGVLIDLDYAAELSERYNKILKEAEQKCYDAVNEYKPQIEEYRAKNSNCKLDDPINIASPTQLAILFYDILKIQPLDKKHPRGTGEEILVKMNNDIAKAILEFRGLAKLVSTYIDKLPDCINPNDGRIHCEFNQYGARTGRFSSENPNLQNIPSRNHDIRKMFVASPGYVMMSSDFSQQEPKCLAALCKKDGDPQMYDTFMQGKDLYSEIASKAFNKTYEDCLEHFPKDTPIKKKGNKWYYATADDYDKLADGETDTYADGKERRSQAKGILLGVLYGRGENSIAEQLNCSVDKAKTIKQSVFKGFPAIKQFEEDSLIMGQDIGYVTTVCGRKRRLPDLQLDEYEFIWKDGAPPDDDLLDFDGINESDEEQEIPERVTNYYLRKLYNCNWKDKYKVIQEAASEGIKITDNSGKIADATRQTVNSRIQGSAADLTKLAMIKLNDNERLKELGFKLLIPVHDEVICECPRENVKECSKLLASIMSHAAEQILEMPIKCDVSITERWYGEELAI